MVVHPTPYARLAVPFVAPLKKPPTFGDIVFRSIRAAVAVFALCILAQWLIYGKLLDDPRIRFVTPTIAAVVTGIVTFRMLKVKRDHILAFHERFRAIGEAHHHIRNALQSISYQRYFIQDTEEAKRLTQAVQRIEWVLNEIFPLFETEKFPRNKDDGPAGGNRTGAA